MYFTFTVKLRKNWQFSHFQRVHVTQVHVGVKSSRRGQQIPPQNPYLHKKLDNIKSAGPQPEHCYLRIVTYSHSLCSVVELHSVECVIYTDFSKLLPPSG